MITKTKLNSIYTALNLSKTWLRPFGLKWTQHLLHGLRPSKTTPKGYKTGLSRTLIIIHSNTSSSSSHHIHIVVVVAVVIIPSVVCYIIIIILLLIFYFTSFLSRFYYSELIDLYFVETKTNIRLNTIS